MDDNARWAAVVKRDTRADGVFVYCVKTTQIFCRPNCRARLARRSNVEFFSTTAEAQAAGYRACKRCRPLLVKYTPEADKIQKACTMLDTQSRDAPFPGLDRLAREAGLTKHHFHRLFKRETGLTPREYAILIRGDSSSDATASTCETPGPQLSSDIGISPMTDVIQSGFTDAQHLITRATSHDRLPDIEMTIVYYNIVHTIYGYFLITFERGQVTHMELGTSPSDLLESLASLFPSSYYIHFCIESADVDDAAIFRTQTHALIEALENPTGKLLDVSPMLALPQFEGPA